MELSMAYREIEKRLQKIDFPSLYRGLYRFPFALYNETQACIDGKTVDRPGEFSANTAVKYNGADTDEELFTRMKMLAGNFVVEVGADLAMTRVWKR